ncbi:zinc finger CCHC domain-containing protein 8 homolog isoform X2 [Chironomus tepperi]|uniref:zinc finger CCHC domain-containing protein 8 homolog isoform X2 n=1 Tax=Chironomus tepperi TaxID=113505 RepID=UPI00391F1AB0
MDNCSVNLGIMEENNEDVVCLDDEFKEEVEDLIDNTTILTPTKCLSSNDKSVQKVLIDINFRNKKTYFAFHEEFIEIIKKYYKDKIDDLDISDDASNKRICISEKLVKKSDSFLIDTTPNIDNIKNAAESTPRYTSFSQVILSNIKDQEEEKSVSTNSANKCFNCDKGTHSLRQCPEPKNMIKIRKARNEFNRRELRYHDNDEYADLVPGQLSDDLKSALGLTDNQLPLHIYKMRNYGYPMAWLEEAKVYYSGLQILTDKNIEFGGDNIRDSFKYDIQRIYDFPGFNVSPNLPFVDKHRLFNLPPMQAHHSKEEFILSLGNDFVVNGYKKRKLRDLIEKLDTSTNVEDVEMDVDNDMYHNQTVTNESSSINLSNKSPEDGELSNNSDNSLNCEELNMERNKLLTELSEINDSQSENDTNLLKSGTNNKRVEESGDIQQGHVETTIFGCPVLPSFSPYEILPSNVKFQEGVCDVIAFENLSESTGKYEKMKGLIKKVRVFVKEHQKD